MTLVRVELIHIVVWKMTRIKSRDNEKLRLCRNLVVTITLVSILVVNPGIYTISLAVVRCARITKSCHCVPDPRRAEAAPYPRLSERGTRRHRRGRGPRKRTVEGKHWVRRSIQRALCHQLAVCFRAKCRSPSSAPPTLTQSAERRCWEEKRTSV